MKNLFKFVFVLLFVFISFSPSVSLAQITSACPSGTRLDVVSRSCVPIVTSTGTGSGGGSGLGFGGAGAVVCPTGASIGGLICQIQQIINSIVPLLIALGVVYFVWGVVAYVIGDDEEAKSKGKDRIIYGIIGFAVIIGLWGFVNIVVRTFDLGGSAAPNFAGLVTQGVSSTGGKIAGCDPINPTSSNFASTIGFFTCLISNSIIPFIFAIATVAFVWGVVNFFIIGGEEEAKREQGKQFMLWGIVSLAVMISFWGLVSILSNTFGVDGKILPSVAPVSNSRP
jgi:hypothetical protein